MHFELRGPGHAIRLRLGVVRRLGREVVPWAFRGKPQVTAEELVFFKPRVGHGHGELCPPQRGGWLGTTKFEPGPPSFVLFGVPVFDAQTADPCFCLFQGAPLGHKASHWAAGAQIQELLQGEVLPWVWHDVPRLW